MRGADVLVRSLAVAGVTRLFTLSGNQIMPVFDACFDEGLELIHVRHEAAAVHMADAFGRLTGEAGIALVTAGPGFANALSALYVAFMAESPLVLISGAAGPRRLGQGAFQEMPQAEIAGRFTKASWETADPARLGHEVARAIRIAKSGRPGPVHLAVPGGVFEARLEGPQNALPQPDDFLPTMSLLDVATARTVLKTLAAARRPMILAGPCMTRGEAPQKLRQLAEALNVPAVGMESPRGLKDPSLGRLREVLREADAVLLLGRPLNFAVAFGAEPAFRGDCRFLMIDPERTILERAAGTLDDSERLALTDLSDVLPAVERLLQSVGGSAPRTDDWRTEVESAIARRPAEWPNLSKEGGPLHPADVCRAIHRFLAAGDDAVFVSDGGEFGQWAQACISAPRRVINGPSGAIGGGIPFALAARVTYPDARIVATVGDGTFGFHALEFDTALRHNLPVTVVVGNDACWNAERQIQLRNYGAERLIGCDLLPTRYDRVVAALGGHGESVTKPADIGLALQRAADSGKPACVNASIEPVAAPA